MIRYDLKCEDGHAFEAWFSSSSGFDDQAKRGLLTCAVCGSPKVQKALMAPRVPKKDAAAEDAPPASGEAEGAPMMSTPVPPEVAKHLAALRKQVEASSEFVGDRFASEARAMHLGDKEDRAIYGRATPDEAKSLLEDGVPVAPLPFVPKRDD